MKNGQLIEALQEFRNCLAKKKVVYVKTLEIFFSEEIHDCVFCPLFRERRRKRKEAFLELYCLHLRSSV